ncbi:MAG: hypothetical protein SV487_11615 [Thermodesulfobacteriota bacterium]|nr:hypothetical protein [Thermodesulfobacteriota bacterium]
MKKTAMILLACAALAWLAGPVLAEDAAMVVDVKNRDAVYESGEKKGRVVMLMDFLAQGDRIKLGPQATIVLNYFASGLREEISGPGVITAGLQASRKNEGADIKAAKVDYIPPQTAARTSDVQHAGVVALRDTKNKTKKLFLLALSDSAARSLPLRFRWAPVSGAEKYDLVLTDVLDTIVFKTGTDQTEVLFQEDKLVLGEEYWWKVRAMSGPEVMAKAIGQFHVLTLEDLGKLEQSEQDIKKRFSQGSAESQIALAMLFQNYRLNDEAKVILLGLRKKHPRNSNIIRQLKMLRTNYDR